MCRQMSLTIQLAASSVSAHVEGARQNMPTEMIPTEKPLACERGFVFHMSRAWNMPRWQPTTLHHGAPSTHRRNVHMLLHKGDIRVHSSWHAMAATSCLAKPPMLLGVVCRHYMCSV